MTTVNLHQPQINTDIKRQASFKNRAFTRAKKIGKHTLTLSVDKKEDTGGAQVQSPELHQRHGTADKSKASQEFRVLYREPAT